MPTTEQIQNEIAQLKEMKPHVRRFSAFGDDNRAAIGAAIKVLEHLLPEGAIYDRWEDLQHLLDSALDARRWLDGAESVAPSSDWKSLVRK